MPNRRGTVLVMGATTESRRASNPRAPVLLLNHGQLALQLLLLFALTGFVCTHKIQAEEECLSSTVLCYDCDSRYDPNCADPFEFPAGLLAAPQTVHQPDVSGGYNNNDTAQHQHAQQAAETFANNVTANNSILPASINTTRPAKKLPQVSLCHGCCVKITSKLADGVTNYVKRTCTTNLQINYFMVGLVCMKESGDRGRMCFCENDLCNGSNPFFSSYSRSHHFLIFLTILAIALSPFV